MIVYGEAAERMFAELEAACKRSDYAWWPRKPYDLFTFGVRAKADETNLFDDRVGMAFVDSRGAPCVEHWKATTDPGRKSMDHPTREAGTATVVPGQVRRCWTKGLHHGKYPCLDQKLGVVIPVWRGNNRRKVWDDAAHIQLHHAFGATRVDWYSAGCFVTEAEADLQRALVLYGYQVAHGHGVDVSLTLWDAEAEPTLGELFLAAA